MIQARWSTNIGGVGQFSPQLLLQLRQVRIAQLPLPSQQLYFPIRGKQLEIPFPNFKIHSS